ncbi:hypothetical protein [Anaerocolumna jejuensis]|uniref:hypothetical protein n=1 Tax=Anaerocolumna jejuensis TaxID=259063 RepID=UPI003F7CACA7
MLDETVTSSQIIILNYLHDNGRLLTGELTKSSPADLKELGRIMQKFKKIIEAEQANKTSEQNI